MRGDFSAWNKDRSHNFRGTLHQQGRVLLDRDWNAQTEIIGEWQESAARDAFGADVAAIPADEPLSLKVVKAEFGGGKVKVSLKKGRAWADGLLVALAADVPLPVPPPDADAVRTATYLGPPFQTAPLSSATPSVGDRDAVILETWLEELSPFQAPGLLFEPALGGVDTTERVHAAFRFRLYRMDDGETCDSIIDDLKDKFDDKGKLTVELKPTTSTDGDCPEVVSGGFTGFEHRLYRVEIADTDTSKPGSYFKWSHFNGGLVGTGDFDNSNPAQPKVLIHGNKNAIVYSGSNSFYLEALDYDSADGYWKPVYGAKATLADDGTIDLSTAAVDIYKGVIPAAPAKGKRFFRLWNGIERIADFTAKKDLPDNLGIIVQFEGEGTGKYTPSDFWTFEVRTSDIGNPRVLIGDPAKVVANAPVTDAGHPPQGVFYHRVPLAEVNWTSNSVTGTDIEDCRRPFQPLTKQKTCCTYRVGDGVSSHGDFKKIQDAIDALPAKGGEICILPGTYEENILLSAPHNKGIILKGCGRRTVIRFKPPGAKNPADIAPVIHVKHGQDITIESLAVEAHDDGIGILLEGVEKDAYGKKAKGYLKDINLFGLYVTAVNRSAIKGYIAQSLALSNSVVYIRESKRTRHPAVYLAGDDMLIERNEIRVLSSRAIDGKTSEELTNDLDLLVPAVEAFGGLQIGGGSERVRIIDNLIVSGSGNGITLGSIDLFKDGEVHTSHDPFNPKGHDDDCCDPDQGHTDDGDEDDDGNTAVAGPPLYDVLIKFNRIFNMGRNGIGIATFFSFDDGVDLPQIAARDDRSAGGMIFISKLVIVENRIERCMNISAQKIPDKMSYLMGYGGISLAIVEGLVIRDNFIIDNCPDCRDPICGIYVLMALGCEVSRNEITEHLRQDYAKLVPEVVNSGPRGGIWIFIAVGQMDVATNSKYERYQDLDVLRGVSGSNAARIHENVVSTPLGRSLTLTTIGDASILGNRFTSYGLQPVNILKLFLAIVAKKSLDMPAFLQILSIITANILIFDLGSFVIFKEFNRVSAAVDTKETVPETAEANMPKTKSEADAEAYELKQARIRQYASVYKKDDDVSRIINLFTRAGLIHFSDNQCKLNPQNVDVGIALCSELIVGLADTGFHNNQLSCNIPRSLLITNALLLGGTLRVTGNWLKETFMHVGYSAVTLGILNSTTDNESVHCLRISGIQFLSRHNLVLSGILAGATGDIALDAGDKLRDFCERRSGISKVLMQMWRVIMQDQDQTGFDQMAGSYIRTPAWEVKK